MFESKEKKAKVKILFKSGNSVDLEVKEFSVEKTDNKLTAISWKGSNILFISLSDIEAIIEF